MAPQLKGALLARAVDLARIVPHRDLRAPILATLAARLDCVGQREVLSEALAAAMELPVAPLVASHDRRTTVSSVAVGLPVTYLREALQAIQLVSDDGSCAETLAALASHLPEPFVRDALERVVGALDTRIPPGADALAGLALRFGELSNPRLALATMNRVGNPLFRDRPLATLASELAVTKQYADALTAARQIESEVYRTRSLVLLVPQLPQELLLSVRDDVQNIDSELGRAEILCALLDRLPTLQKEQILSDLLRLVLQPKLGRGVRYFVLSEVVDHIAPDSIETWLDVARSDPEGRDPVPILARVAPRLPEPWRTRILGEALAGSATLPITEMETSRSLRCEVLMQLIPSLPRELQSEAMREAFLAARAVRDPRRRSMAFITLAKVVADPMRTHSGHQALVAVEQVDERERGDAIRALAPHLDISLVAETWRIACQLSDSEQSAKALMGLVSFMPIQDRPMFAAEAFMLIRDTPSLSVRANALLEMSDYLPEELKSDAISCALKATREIGYVDEGLICPIVQRVPHQGASEILRHCLKIALDSPPRQQTADLHKVAPYLARLPVEDLEPIWTEVLHALGAQARSECLLSLCALVPALIALGGPAAAEETYDAIVDSSRWWP